MKKVLALLLAILMCCMFAACGVNNNLNSNQVEIEFYQQDEQYVDLFDEIIKAFEKEYPNIKVKQINLPEEESGNVLNSRILNNDTPDIFNSWFSQDLFDMIDYGCIRDMTNSELSKKISPEILSQTKYNGKTYMLPMTTNYMGVYYNIDIFEKYNLSVPTTLDELWTVCDVLESNGITPFSAGYKDGWNLAHWVQDVIGNVMPSYSSDFKSIFNGEISGYEMDGIGEVADIVLKVASYVQDGVLGADTEMSIVDFVSSNTAMTINGSWIMSSISAAASDDFNYAVFPFPTNDATSLRVMSNADYSFILSSKSSPEKQVAAETFLTYMFKDGVKHFIDVTNSPCCVKGVSPNTEKYILVNSILEQGKVFRMPNSGRWTDQTYLDYTVALQNLVANGNKETFYKEFEEALTSSGITKTYID